MFGAIPPWGLKAVPGGPQGGPCFQDCWRMAFFLVVLDARSGRVMGLVGSNVGADGQPVALGRRVRCPE